MKNLLKKIRQIPWEKCLLLMDQVMVSGSNFLLGILLVRALGLENYGIFALLWMLVLFALGINQALITKPIMTLASKMEVVDSSKYLLHVQWIQAGLAALFLIVGLVIWLVRDIFSLAIPNMSLIPILSGVLFFQLFHDYFRKRCFIEGKIKGAFAMDFLLYMGQLFLIAILWFQGILTLDRAFYCILVANFLSVVLGGSYFKIEIPNTTELLETWKKQVHYSKWLVGTALLQWFSGNYFILIGATIIGPIAVGAIRMVQNIMGFFHILFLSMENIVPIETARQFHDGGWTAMTQYLKKTTLKLGLAFLLLLVAVSTLAPWLIKLLYGVEYLDYSYVVVVYCGLYILVFLSIPLQFALRTIELTYPLFVAYIIATVFSFLAANFFLNEWGMSGLLAGLIITQFITFVTYAAYCWRQNRIKIRNCSAVDY